MADVAIREQSEVIAVPFHGEEILTVDVGGDPHIVLRPALERIGIDYAAQYTKLKSRSWATVGHCPMVAADGKVRDMVTVDVQTFLMLLATIDENRVGVDVKPTLVLYQAEVAKAVEDYWTKGKAVNPRAEELKTPAEMLLYHAQVAVNHERKIKALEGKVTEIGARMDGIEQNTGWLTALAFAKLNRLPTDTPSLQRLGIAAKRVCIGRGIEPRQVRNDRYGLVGLYPEECLAAAAGLVVA